MDAVEFCKTVNRLCRNQDCNVCPVKEKGRCMVGFDDTSIRNIEETVSKVEQWAKDHPVKTRQSEFLKMFPNVIMAHGVIALRPCRLDTRLDMKKDCLCSDLYSDCDECKMAYWLSEVTDND